LELFVDISNSQLQNIKNLLIIELLKNDVMKYTLNLIILFFFTLLFHACNNNFEDNIAINDDTVLVKLPNVLEFSSNEQLQGFLDETKDEKGLDLNSNVIVQKLN
jgi:hypothetical protein